MDLWNKDWIFVYNWPCRDFELWNLALKLKKILKISPLTPLNWHSYFLPCVNSKGKPSWAWQHEWIYLQGQWRLCWHKITQGGEELLSNQSWNFLRCLWTCSSDMKWVKPFPFLKRLHSCQIHLQTAEVLILCQVSTQSVASWWDSNGF